MRCVLSRRIAAFAGSIQETSRSPRLLRAHVLATGALGTDSADDRIPWPLRLGLAAVLLYFVIGTSSFVHRPSPARQARGAIAVYPASRSSTPAAKSAWPPGPGCGLPRPFFMSAQMPSHGCAKVADAIRRIKEALSVMQVRLRRPEGTVRPIGTRSNRGKITLKVIFV
jgi:hypothetical protein